MAMENSQPLPAPIAAEQSYIQRVYQWMSLGLALTGFVALWVSRSPAIMNLISIPMMFLIGFLMIGLVVWLSPNVTNLSPTAACAGFLIFSALNGFLLSIFFAYYTKASIASTFFITAGTFAAASFYGWTTKTNLLSFGGFFKMLLLGFIIASFANIWLSNPLLYWVLNYIGVVLFIGLAAYDVQMLKCIYQSGKGTTEQMAICGALNLYMDFINLFLNLLSILGKRRD